LAIVALAAACGSHGQEGTGASSGSGGSSSSGQPDGGALRAIPLTGCPLNFYFAPITVAGQSFTVIVDTGSTDMALALSSCTTCGVSPELSAPAGTCSAQPEQSLGWAGDECSETVSVGGEIPEVTMNMVGITTNTSFFTNDDCTQQPISNAPTPYQGILGLGPPVLDTLGQAADDAYVGALVSHGVADAFGLLLCSVGGRMWFGGYDPTFASGPPEYTPLTMAKGWTISVSSVGLGSTNLGPGDPETILDTGSQFYSIPKSSYDAFIDHADPSFTTIFGSSTLGAIFGSKACVSPSAGQTQAQIDMALPPMTMTLPSTGGGSFTLSLAATASYLVPATPSAGGALQYCLAIKDSAETGNFSILGGPLMRANITVFDVKGDRIGFAPQTFCN
jgi:hypothetical protein